MNQGFFTKEEIKSNNYQPRKRTSCFTCGLYKTCRSPKMKVTGEGKKGILAWAEAPGEEEDKRGEQLVGKAGTLLRRAMKRLGIDLDEDCWKINSVNCRPVDSKGNNRTPTDAEIEACRPMVWKDVIALKPKAIFLMGGIAIKSFLGHRWPDSLDGIGKWRGWRIPDREAGAWVMPMFHPSYVDRSKNYQPVVRTIFEQDLARAIEQIDILFPEYEDEKKLIRILSEEEAIQELKYIYRSAKTMSKPIHMAFDYEATGLKPHAPGHRIVMMSLCVRPSEAVVFGMVKKDMTISWELEKAVRKVLTCPQILKTAHNIKFEHNWTQELLRTEVIPWLHCSMNGAHVQDNRPGITGLKFQGYINFGILPWGEEINSFLRGDKNNANSFNQIDEIPFKELAMYCGIDSLVEYRLVEKQRREMRL